MYNVAGKVWGLTAEIFSNHNFEVHRIEVNKDGFCSKHKHIHKFNAFYMEKGTLEITIYKNDYDLIDKTIINTGQITIAKPGEFHEFKALTDCICYEIYWVELNHTDIERETVGGNK